MYIDAAVVFVTSHSLLFKLALAILCFKSSFEMTELAKGPSFFLNKGLRPLQAHKNPTSCPKKVFHDQSKGISPEVIYEIFSRKEKNFSETRRKLVHLHFQMKPQIEVI